MSNWPHLHEEADLHEAIITLAMNALQILTTHTKTHTPHTQICKCTHLLFLYTLSVKVLWKTIEEVIL